MNDKTTVPKTWANEKTYTRGQVLNLIRRMYVVNVLPKHAAHQKTIYLRIPDELQPLAMDGVCTCGRRGCDGANNNARWDTLAIQGVRGEHPWTVHAPEWQWLSETDDKERTGKQ